MKYTEIETKYRADEMSLVGFHTFCKERTPEHYLYSSGYDHFYHSTKDANSFCRHRNGTDLNELTFKRKTSDANSFIRTEHNIDLAKHMSQDQIQALCGEFGYEYNTSIFKTCFVYRFDWYVLSYYICYDKEMKESGRFFEIEAREDYKWSSETEAWDQIKVMERFCKALGITPQNRMKTSLFELYRK